MNKKQIAGIGIGLATLGGGTAIQIDKNINPYTETTTKLEIVADSLTPEAGVQKIIASKDEPKVTLSKWNGEVSLGVKYTGISQATQGSRPFLSKNVHWKEGDITLEAVPIDPTPTDEGGMEINVLLDSKPTTNVFTFQLENWQNLDFFYQPELTPEEIQEGVVRPENVVGSYAVFYKNKRNHILGQTNYGSGKAYHIYRPKVFDDKGNEVWANMSYSDGVLSVTVPQDFLDNAVYPVVVDPTFGNTNIGGSSAATANVICSYYPTTEGSDVSKLTMYNLQDAGNTVAGAIYTDSGTYPNTKVAEDSGNTSGTGANAWLDVNITATLSGSTNYWLCTWGSDSRTIFWDAGSANQYVAQGMSFETWEDPFSGGGTQFARALSVYATYTASTPPTVPIPKAQINAPVNINSNLSI